MCAAYCLPPPRNANAMNVHVHIHTEEIWITAQLLNVLERVGQKFTFKNVFASIHSRTNK